MNIELTHSFKRKAHDLDGLLDRCNKMSTYRNRLNKQAALHPDRYDPNKYKGDGLELFAEALIRLSPCDNRIGIGNYEVIPRNRDRGVDGVGIGANGKPATVQVKYYSNTKKQLTTNEDRLSNFVSCSQNRYGVDINDDKNMLVVTTANSLNPFTDTEMLHGKVRCLGWNQLRQLVDNNQLFWDAFRNLCGV